MGDGRECFGLERWEIWGILCWRFLGMQPGGLMLCGNGRIGDVNLPNLAAATLPLAVDLACFGELFAALK